jgi:hypothetical protein
VEGGTIPEELRVLVDEKKAKSKATKEERNAERRRSVPLLDPSCFLFRDKDAFASLCVFRRFVVCKNWEEGGMRGGAEAPEPSTDGLCKRL